MDPFYKHWFRGFEEALIGMPEAQRSCLLACCGRACSESYSLLVYRRVRAESADVADFFDRLRQEIPAIEIEEMERGSVYEIRYRECLCDLHRDGLVHSPALCECSRQSLLYNLSQAFPEKRIDVSLRGSILAGDGRCVLRATLE